MKYWITKYALTKGIYEVEAELSSTGNNTIIIRRELGRLEFFHGSDWHETKEAALEHVEEMRQKKINSLEAQLDRIRSLEFEA